MICNERGRRSLEGGRKLEVLLGLSHEGLAIGAALDQAREQVLNGFNLLALFGVGFESLDSKLFEFVCGLSYLHPELDVLISMFDALGGHGSSLLSDFFDPTFKPDSFESFHLLILHGGHLLLFAQRRPVSHHAGLGCQVLRGGGGWSGQRKQRVSGLREFV